VATGSFLSEAISLTDLRNPLFTAISKSIEFSISQIANWDPTSFDPPDVTYKQRVMQLSITIAESVGESVSKVISTRLETETSVSFNTLGPGVRGLAKPPDIYININFIHPISGAIISWLFDQAMRANDKDVGQRIVELSIDSKQMWQRIEPKATDLIRQMISTLIHEAVHVAQAVAYRKAGRIDVKDRSYLERDKQKLQLAIDDIAIGNPTQQSSKAYRSIDREIAAFAHEAALAFIDDHDGNPTQQDVQMYLPKYANQLFDRYDRKERVPYNRFYKLLYNEVVRFMERNK
jgi:hypothetical protein